MNDFWIKFGELINLLKEENKQHIASELKEVQFYVNGLTDGWYNFKEVYNKIIQYRKYELTKHQLYLALNLLNKLEAWLLSR